MRRDISMNIKERVYQAAFVFLVLFAVMVIYNDLDEDDSGAGGQAAVNFFSQLNQADG